MSLRLRLVLSVATVVVVSFAAMYVATSRVVRVQFSEITAVPSPLPPVATGEIGRTVAAHHRAHGLAGMDALLRRLREQHGRELILVDDANRIVATSHREKTTGSFVADRKGIAIGSASLHVLPPMRSRTRAAMASDANRWLLVIVTIVGLGALLSTAIVARRLFRPIEALQVAVERVRGGQLGEEVAVTSSDEVGKLAGAFNEMSRQLARDEVLRRNIVNDVAHELRTPLTNLICTVEAIQDGLRSADARVIDSVHDDLMLLQRLVDDLQTLALAEGGQLPLHLEALDVRDEIERAVRDEARVVIDVEDGLLVRGDRTRFQQIVLNLVRNAFTHGGDVHRIAIAAHVVGEQVRLTVSDDGAGIAAEHLPHIFDRFYRADASRARATGGAGLGLAIVKNLVELQGGRIGAASTPGAGTTFRIDLPLFNP